MAVGPACTLRYAFPLPRCRALARRAAAGVASSGLARTVLSPPRLGQLNTTRTSAHGWSCPMRQSARGRPPEPETDAASAPFQSAATAAAPQAPRCAFAVLRCALSTDLRTRGLEGLALGLRFPIPQPSVVHQPAQHQTPVAARRAIASGRIDPSRQTRLVFPGPAKVHQTSSSRSSYNAPNPSFEPTASRRRAWVQVHCLPFTS